MFLCMGTFFWNILQNRVTWSSVTWLYTDRYIFVFLAICSVTSLLRKFIIGHHWLNTWPFPRGSALQLAMNAVFWHFPLSAYSKEEYAFRQKICMLLYFCQLCWFYNLTIVALWLFPPLLVYFGYFKMNEWNLLQNVAIWFEHKCFRAEKKKFFLEGWNYIDSPTLLITSTIPASQTTELGKQK